MDSSQENGKFHEEILEPCNQMIQKGMIFCINCGDHFTFIEELSGHCDSVENCQTLENERYLKKYMKKTLQSDNSEETRYDCALCKKSFPWMSPRKGLLPEVEKVRIIPQERKVGNHSPGTEG